MPKKYRYEIVKALGEQHFLTNINVLGKEGWKIIESSYVLSTDPKVVGYYALMEKEE